MHLEILSKKVSILLKPLSLGIALFFIYSIIVFVETSTYDEDLPESQSSDHMDEDRSTSVSPILYSTFLGGNSGVDYGHVVQVDDEGNIYIAGSTQSRDFPIKPEKYNFTQDTDTNESRRFLVKISSDGSTLIYSIAFPGYMVTDPRNTFLRLDDEGCAYFGGTSNYAHFPITEDALQKSIGGLYDVFIAKIASDGLSFDYFTYFGGAENDTIRQMVISEDNRIFVLGQTYSEDLPTTDGAMQTTYGGNCDLFLLKLDPDNPATTYSTYIGGRDPDYMSILDDPVFDQDGNIVIVGATTSDDFPITSGAYQTEFIGLDDTDCDAIIMKVEVDSCEVVFSTYLGGDNRDYAVDHCVDDNGDVYIVGHSISSDFPTTPGKYQGKPGSEDVFVSKISADGSSLIYSVLIGGSDSPDQPRMMALTDDGSVYVYGRGGDDFPTTSNAIIRDSVGNGDAFVFKLAPDGTTLLYSTFIGGVEDEKPFHLLLDENENVVIMGWTESPDFPITENALQDQLLGNDYSAYLSIIDHADGSLQYSTYLGGSEADYVLSMTIGPLGTIFLVGWTHSLDYPITSTSLKSQNAGANAFLTRVYIGIFVPSADAGPDVMVDLGDNVDLDGSGSIGNFGIVNWTWTFVYNGSTHDLYGATQQIRYDLLDNYQVTLTVVDRIGLTASDTMIVRVRDIIDPEADAGEDIVVEQNQEVIFNGTNSWDEREIDTWNWSFSYNDSEQNLTGPSPSFIFEIPGEYNVTLEVIDTGGNRAKDWVTVDVVPIPEDNDEEKKRYIITDSFLLILLLLISIILIVLSVTWSIRQRMKIE